MSAPDPVVTVLAIIALDGHARASGWTSARALYEQNKAEREEADALARECGFASLGDLLEATEAA